MTDTTPAEIIARIEPPGPLGEPLRGALGNRAALAVEQALIAAGYIIVPKDPDEAQIAAGQSEEPMIHVSRFSGIYRAMTEAHKDTGA